MIANPRGKPCDVWSTGTGVACARCGFLWAEHSKAARSAAPDMSRALNGEGRAQRLIVSLSEDDRVALVNLSESRGISQAEVVRELIRDEVKRG